MYIDARDLNSDQVLESDLCIIGAGAAGITIAREFIGTSTDVLLLESGGFEFDERTHALSTGNNIGLRTFPLERNRLRYFGGTTNHWAGHCRPLDPIDFEKKEWMPHSGWPIKRADLDPFYIRAQPILGLGEYKYNDLGFFEKALGQPALDFEQRRIKTVVYGQSPPTRFGQVYREELGAAKNIRVCLHANVLELVPGPGGKRVDSIRVACFDGPRFSVKARNIVLATGGMENARLLLLSDRLSAKGLGNDHDMVGRFFMDHVLLRPGADISLTKPGTRLGLYFYPQVAAGGKMFAVLSAPEELIRREKLGNFRIHLTPDQGKYARSMGGLFSRLDGFAGDVPVAKLPGHSTALHMVLEPFPNPDSRITLSRAHDELRQRKLNVKWLLTPTELKNAHRVLELAAMEFGRAGIGRGYGAIFKDKTRWPGNLEAGRHHCGTTRMSADPRSGVVDANCRVHGLQNLYIAGSSVFPTIGYANPALTIVALGLRLADHIKGQKT